jgi:hypothetical protein
MLDSRAKNARVKFVLFRTFYYVEQHQCSSSFQDTELPVNRFVDLEALEANSEEPEDEVEDNAGACASKLSFYI